MRFDGMLDVYMIKQRAVTDRLEWPQLAKRCACSEVANQGKCFQYRKHTTVTVS